MSQHKDPSASNEELTELRRQLAEKVQLLEFGRQIGQIALASADLDEVLDSLARQVIETGLFDVLMIALVDVKADRVVPVRSWIRDQNESSDRASVTALDELGVASYLRCSFQGCYRCGLLQVPIPEGIPSFRLHLDS